MTRYFTDLKLKSIIQNWALPNIILTFQFIIVFMVILLWIIH